MTINIFFTRNEARARRSIKKRISGLLKRDTHTRTDYNYLQYLDMMYNLTSTLAYKRNKELYSRSPRKRVDF